MRTIDHKISTRSKFWNNLRRDLALLLRIAAMLLSFFARGSRIRRRYQSMASKGEVFLVDEEFNR